MLSEWSAECSQDAPTLVVPWSDPDGSAHFIDLRANPYDLAEIPEAEQHPALARALRSLNATRSPFLTAKCDAWPLTPAAHAEQLEALPLELMLDPTEVKAGFASYIDVLWRERSVFASAHQQQDRLDRIIRRAQRLPHREASLQCVLRPAVLDLNGPLEGFSVSLYVTALGPEAAIAHRRWELALEDVVALLRGRDLEAPRGSATIDAADAYPLRVRHVG
jgi:hypothetical protein